MVRRIVVTLDGSSLAETILPQAVALARATKVGLTLVRVIPPLNVAGYSGVAIIPEHWYEQEVVWTRDYLNQVAGRLREERLEADIEILDGEPAIALLAYIEEHPTIELVAMATHGRSGISRWVMGSVATKVMQVAMKPVVLLHSHNATVTFTPPVSYQTLVVPLDGTAEGERALELAQPIALASGANLVLVLVAANETQMHSGKKSEYLEQKAHQLRAQGLTVQVEEGIGDPTELLEHLSQNGEYDVLAITTHRKSSEHIIMKFIHQVDIPVLLVPEQEAQVHRHQ